MTNNYYRCYYHSYYCCCAAIGDADIGAATIGAADVVTAVGTESKLLLLLVLLLLSTDISDAEDGLSRTLDISSCANCFHNSSRSVSFFFSLHKYDTIRKIITKLLLSFYFCRSAL